MNKLLYLIIAIFVISLGFSISHWVDKPIKTDTTHSNSSKNCVVCHQKSLSHEAWKGVPVWHNTEFCNPVLNSENREEHRREAHNHRNKCMTCHASNFQAKCANCHTQNEW